MSDVTVLNQGEKAHVLAAGQTIIELRKRLTVRELAIKLVEIEKEFGYERALLCLELYSYASLNALVAEGGADNDPHLMPSRFCILAGATDKGLAATSLGAMNGDRKNLDAFPYELHQDAPHTMSVQSLADLLIFAGYVQSPLPRWAKAPATPSGDGSAAEQEPLGEPRQFDEMDDELVGAMYEFLKNATPPFPDTGLSAKTWKVEAGDSLSSIARSLGIRNWRLIWELNKDALGTQWDVPPVGTELKLPDPTVDPLGEEKPFAQWMAGFANPLERVDKGYQYPGTYLSLTYLDPDGQVLSLSPPLGFSVHLRVEGFPLIHHARIARGDEIDFIVPDAPLLGWGLQEHPTSALGKAWFYYAEDALDDDGSSDLSPIEKNQFDRADSIQRTHIASNKAKQK